LLSENCPLTLSELQVVVSWFKKCCISNSLEGKDKDICMRNFGMDITVSSVEEESGDYCLIWLLDME
jgi:hypothetical protein